MGGGGQGREWRKRGTARGQCRFEAIVSEVMGLIVWSEGEPGCKNKEEIEVRDKKKSSNCQRSKVKRSPGSI